MQNNTLALVLLCLELLNSFGRMLKFESVKKLLAKQSKKNTGFRLTSFIRDVIGGQADTVSSINSPGFTT